MAKNDEHATKIAAAIVATNAPGVAVPAQAPRAPRAMHQQSVKTFSKMACAHLLMAASVAGSGRPGEVNVFFHIMAAQDAARMAGGDYKACMEAGRRAGAAYKAETKLPGR